MPRGRVIHRPAKRQYADLRPEIKHPGAPPAGTVLLTPKEVATVLRISPKTLSEWRYLKRELRYYTVTNRPVYALDDVCDWLDGKAIEAGLMPTHASRRKLLQRLQPVLDEIYGPATTRTDIQRFLIAHSGWAGRVA